MFRTPLRKSLTPLLGRKTLLTACSRRAFSSPSAVAARSGARTWMTPSLVGVGASSFVAYLAYQWTFNVAYADSQIKEQPEISSGFPTNEFILSGDVETHTNLLTVNDIVVGTTEDVTIVEEEGDESDDDAPNQGAYNPETGEINWDCPCLGGMANGPCGEEFKAAFSCFVYSEADPKGIDCIDKFQHMQDCFRKYPEVYSEELREEPPVESPSDESEPSTGEHSVGKASVEDTPAKIPVKSN